MKHSKLSERIYRVLEVLFLAITSIYLIYSTESITTLKLTWPADFEQRLLIAMAILAILRLLSTPLFRRKTLAALGLVLIYVLVYRSVEYRFLLFLAALTVGLIDIDYRKILKVYLISVGGVYCIAVFAGFLGVITNYVYTSAGRGVRSAWGICYPTDLSSITFFLLILLLIPSTKV